MKKSIASILVLIVLIIYLPMTNFSCSIRRNYPWLHPTEDISSVSFVHLTFDEDRKMSETHVRTVDDTDGFIRDFQSVKCYVWFGPPLSPAVDEKNITVIKVTYKNGDYELISEHGRATYKSDRGFSFYAGITEFDNDQLYKVMEKYCPGSTR